jgi:lysophospholipase L1-like esterase
MSLQEFLSNFSSERISTNNLKFKKKILCFGDSLTAGHSSKGYFPYADRLNILLEDKYKVEHIGMSGWTTEQMVLRSHYERNQDCFERVWKGFQFKLNNSQQRYEYVFILSGTNDIGDREGPQKTVRYLEALVNIALTRYVYTHMVSTHN